MLRKKAKHLANRAWRSIRSPLLTAKSIKIVRNMGQSDADHIFVVGIPRAGTSLMATILAAHDDVASLNNETHFFRVRNYQYLSLPGVSNEQIEDFLRASSSRVEMFDHFAANSLRQEPGSKRFLEKTPDHGQVAASIMNAYPKAQMLIAFRDPLDAYSSLMNGKNMPRPAPEKFARYWARVAEQSQLAPQDRTMRFKYEDLVTDPEGEARKVCEFLGLEFSERLIDPQAHAANAPEYRKRGNHDRIGRAITPASIGKWREHLDNDSAAKIIEICREPMQALGYSVPEL